MRSKTSRWMTAAAAACTLLLVGYADGATSSTPSTTIPPPKPPIKTWIVIEVVNSYGVTSYEAVQSQGGIHDRSVRLQKEYLAAVEKWKKDKVLAEINKTKFDTPRPVRGTVKRAETTPASFRYAELARAEAAVLTKKMRERQAAKTEGKTSAASEAPRKADPSAPHPPPSGRTVTPGAPADNDAGAGNQAP